MGGSRNGTSMKRHRTSRAPGASSRRRAPPGRALRTGGADSAGRAAVYLARHAKSVTILVRGPSLERSMSYYLIKQIADVPNISVRTCTEVVAAQGDDHLAGLTLRSTADGSTGNVDAQLLFLFIGAAPLTDWLEGGVAW